MPQYFSSLLHRFLQCFKFYLLSHPIPKIQSSLSKFFLCLYASSVYFTAWSTMNHTLAHGNHAVSPWCLFYDFKKQTAPATIFSPSLFLSYKSILFQIRDAPLYSTDRQVQFSGNGTDCRITSSFPVGPVLQIQINCNGSVRQLRFIYFSVCDTSSFLHRVAMYVTDLYGFLCLWWILSAYQAHQSSVLSDFLIFCTCSITGVCCIPPPLILLLISGSSSSSSMRHMFLRTISSSISCLSA